MKRQKFIIWVCITLASFNLQAQFRVIGYVSSFGTLSPDVGRIDFKKLTHINIAFVNPDSTANLLLPDYLDTLVTLAHQNNVKVLASIGGGYYNPHYKTLLSDANRPALIQQLLALATDHALDGLDIDLEGEAIDRNYDKLIADLSHGLKPLNKLLTAAFATWNANILSNDALKKFDFINIMSYDQTGPWRPKEPGQHSTYAKAEEDIDYWINTRGIAKKRINLGVPFYGYCFGTKYGESMSFEQIVTNFPGSEENDMAVPETGGIIYYNGIPTIKTKTALALKKTGGVMIWQIMQDATGANSLLTTIHDAIGPSK